MEVTQHEEPPRYEHGETCTDDDLYEIYEDLLGCRECEGMFDKTTKRGLAITDRRFL